MTRVRGRRRSQRGASAGARAVRLRAGCGQGDPAAGSASATPAPTTVASAASPSPTPSPTPVTPGPGDHEMFLAFEGDQRRALVHAPASYRKGTPVALVVAMHGRPSSADELRRMSGLDATADRFGFVVVYPDARVSSWNALECCPGGDDVGFVKTLVARFVAEWGVDPKRVYATGFSNGASMTYKLAVEASDVFAAAAPISGGFFGGRADDDARYRPAKPVSLVTVTGEGDRQQFSFGEGRERWAANLGCRMGKAEFVDPGRTVSRTAGRCKDGSEFVSYVVDGMGHTWPSATGTPTAIDANDVMWRFFESHPRR